MSTSVYREAPTEGSSQWQLLRSAGGLLRRTATHYILRRSLVALAKIIFVVSLTFFIVRLMPTNPIDAHINELMTRYGLSYEDAQNQTASLFSMDLDAPLHTQYFQYMQGLVEGDLGMSYSSQGTPVSQLIARYLPWTLFSVGVALLISFTVGMGMGMIMAFKRESLLDHTFAAIGSVLSSVPNYLLGMMLLVFLGVQWEVLPITEMRGSRTPGIPIGFSFLFLYDIFFHASLPILTYVVATIGNWMLTMKSSTISTLGEDYVTVARARGLRDRRIITAYVGRNAALPLFTQLAISIGFIVGGSALIEQIFVYQGVGWLLINAINFRDYPVMQGVFLIITISVILANFLAEFLYSRLDPRIRTGGQ